MLEDPLLECSTLFRSFLKCRPIVSAFSLAFPVSAAALAAAWNNALAKMLPEAKILIPQARAEILPPIATAMSTA